MTPPFRANLRENKGGVKDPQLLDRSKTQNYVIFSAQKARRKREKIVILRRFPPENTQKVQKKFAPAAGSKKFGLLSYEFSPYSSLADLWKTRGVKHYDIS